jgi:hypothetical protein
MGTTNIDILRPTMEEVQVKHNCAKPCAQRIAERTPFYNVRKFFFFSRSGADMLRLQADLSNSFYVNLHFAILYVYTVTYTVELGYNVIKGT